MPRVNLLVIFLVAIVSVACYQQVNRNPYGRYLTYVLEQIDKQSLERVPQADLFDGAMDGIVARLDQYSSYINAADAAKFKSELRQQFGGVGVMITLKPENEEEGAKTHLTVISPPLFGTPAQKAGIRFRDRILEIDGASTDKMRMADVIRQMRGDVGKPVELLVLHEGETEPERFTIIRAMINEPSVRGDRPNADGSWDYRLEHDQRIGYVRVRTFGEKTSGEVAAAMATLRKQRADAVILDLRDNAGGLLDAAVEVCDMFLPGQKLIVSIRGRGGQPQKAYNSSGKGKYLDQPMVLLVSQYTASASEIVAACLQDHGRAIVVGERTWGKGTVQQVIDIESGKSILKLTSASYWRHSGKNIHRMKDAQEKDQWGVLPNEGFAVELSDEQKKRWRKDRSRRDIFRPEEARKTDSDGPQPPEANDDDSVVDPVLQRAVDHLQKRLKEREAVPRVA